MQAPTLRHVAQFGVVAAVLVSQTACLEHFESLRTVVTYDPYAQLFHVERRLAGIDARFLGCRDVDGCVAAVRRTFEGGSSSLSPSLSDRLLQRLLESGATDVTLTLEQDGDRLDAIVTYGAPVGSAAADDTLVRAEWDNRGWPFGHYYLVVTAQDSMDPPGRHRTRKVARAGAGGVDWIEEWVLPRTKRSVETVLDVAEVAPLFAEVPGLDQALANDGLLDEPRLVAVDNGDAEASAWVVEDAALPTLPTVEAEPAPTSVRSERAARAEAPRAETTRARGSTGSGGADDPTSVALDPQSPAKTWVYEPRVSGGGVTPAVAGVALEPLVPSLSRCYQRRQQEVPTLEGSVFLSALVRGDGTVVATSVSGAMTDPPLLACIDRALAAWSFPAWDPTASPDLVSDVAVPIVFRVERGAPKERR